MKIWYGSSTVGLELYAIGNEAIYFGSEPNEGEGKSIETELNKGASPAKALPKDTETIILTSICKISADITRNEIEVTYKNGKNEHDETMQFNDKESFEEAYAYLKDTFGDTFVESKDHYSVPRAAYGSLWAFTVFGFLTWLFYSMAESIAEEGDDSRGKRAKLLVSVLELLGPTGVAIVGGIVILMVLTYLVSRVRNPPIYLILHKGNYKKSGSIRVSFNYLILGVVWVFMLKILLQ